jgi:hypothetical protein
VARSANRPVTLFDAAKLHDKFTFNSSQLNSLTILTFIIFCNVICFLKTGYYGNNNYNALFWPVDGAHSQYANRGHN